MTSIRETISVCRNDGGFSTVVRCVDINNLCIKIYRSGTDYEYGALPKACADDCDACEQKCDCYVNEQFCDECCNCLYAVENKGDTYYFALPSSFWCCPIGFYDADLYYGDQFVRTIRLELYATPESGKSKVLISESACDDKCLPNIETVIDCPEEIECPDNECCYPEGSKEPFCSDGEEEPEEEPLIMMSRIGGPPLVKKQVKKVDGDQSASIKTLINEAKVATSGDLVRHISALINELEGLSSRGYHYNQRQKIPESVKKQIEGLKNSLSSINSGQATMDQTTAQAFVLSEALSALRQQIVSENKTSKIQETRTQDIKLLAPDPVPRPPNMGEYIADKFEKVIKDGKS